MNGGQCCKNMCSKTILLSTFNKRLCFVIAISIRLKALDKFVIDSDMALEQVIYIDHHFIL